jgi:hypothetical protein
MNRTQLSVALSLACVTLTAGPVAAQAPSQFAQVPVEFQGDWVAAQATCDAPVRFRVEVTKLTLVNGADSQSFGGVEMAGPGYWGPDYKGIEAVAFAEFNGDQPVIATFNLNEKKGVAQVGFAQVTPRAPPNSPSAALNARTQKLNLTKRFPLHQVPLKKCPARAASAQTANQPATQSAASAAARPAGAASSAAQPRAQAASICGGQPSCDEVPGFAAVITDFRTSVYDQSTRVVSATIRFENKGTRPLLLGYVANAGVAIDEQGNRYTIGSAANVRGIAPIAGGEFDPKFSVQPGQAADTRFEFSWRWNGRDIIGRRAWDLELTVREVNEVAPGQYRFGQEHVLEFKGLSPAAMTSAAPAGGAIATVPGGTAPTGAASAAAASTGAAPATPTPIARPAQIPSNEPDACEGKATCSDAGPFVAEIVNVTTTRFNAARPWHTVALNVRFRNKTTEPITLGYVAGSGVLIDDLGNRYAPSTAPDDAKGIGRVQANRADPQFVLRPGETRAATFGLARVMRGTPNAAVIGSSYTFDVSIAQLEVLYNGQQVRTVREHSMTFPGFAVSGPGAASTAAAPSGASAGAPTADEIKKAGEAIRNIFRGRGQK